jgi:Mg/Co/Ni transporter MgtE
MSEDVQRMLGKIDGKLDQVIDTFREHREDDKRRFTEVHSRLDEHAEDINRAKGAKATVLWLVGGGAAAVTSAVVYAAKAFG